jgi:hypothetical protein
MKFMGIMKAVTYISVCTLEAILDPEASELGREFFRYSRCEQISSISDAHFNI